MCMYLCRYTHTKKDNQMWQVLIMDESQWKAYKSFGTLKNSNSGRRKFPILYRTKLVGIQSEQKESPLIRALHFKYLGINFEWQEDSFYRKFNYLIRRQKGKVNWTKRDVVPWVGRLTVVKILVLKLMHKFWLKIGINGILFWNYFPT